MLFIIYTVISIIHISLLYLILISAAMLSLSYS